MRKLKAYQASSPKCSRCSGASRISLIWHWHDRIEVAAPDADGERALSVAHHARVDPVVALAHAVERPHRFVERPGVEILHDGKLRVRQRRRDRKRGQQHGGEFHCGSHWAMDPARRSIAFASVRSNVAVAISGVEPLHGPAVKPQPVSHETYTHREAINALSDDELTRLKETSDSAGSRPPRRPPGAARRHRHGRAAGAELAAVARRRHGARDRAHLPVHAGARGDPRHRLPHPLAQPGRGRGRGRPRRRAAKVVPLFPFRPPPPYPGCRARPRARDAQALDWWSYVRHLSALPYWRAQVSTILGNALGRAARQLRAGLGPPPHRDRGARLSCRLCGLCGSCALPQAGPGRWSCGWCRCCSASRSSGPICWPSMAPARWSPTC
jgi:hypothetical protein